MNCLRHLQEERLTSQNLSSPLAGEEEFQHELESARNSGEGCKIAHRNYEKYIKDFAREMRKNSTNQELKLWAILKNNGLGYKFRRQFAVDNKYIADFVCLEQRIIVELDGGQHNECISDINRTWYLERQKFRLIRFWNDEIDNNIEGCVEVLICELNNTPHPGPLPQGARGNAQTLVLGSKNE